MTTTDRNKRTTRANKGFASDGLTCKLANLELCTSIKL